MHRCTIAKNLSGDDSSCVLKEEHASDEIKLSDIHEPHHNDVLMGRGGKNNQHVGNEQLRSIARGRNLDYQNASKKGTCIKYESCPISTISTNPLSYKNCREVHDF